MCALRLIEKPYVDFWSTGVVFLPGCIFSKKEGFYQFKVITSASVVVAVVSWIITSVMSKASIDVVQSFENMFIHRLECFENFVKFSNF